jgi:hypothetical protein
MVKIKLKPCPFCGGKAELQECLFQTAPDCGYERVPSYDSFYVHCNGCSFARLPYWGTSNYNTREQAIEAWNTRYIGE